jgi:hypothetical protein
MKKRKMRVIWLQEYEVTVGTLGNKKKFLLSQNWSHKKPEPFDTLKPIKFIEADKVKK